MINKEEAVVLDLLAEQYLCEDEEKFSGPPGATDTCSGAIPPTRALSAPNPANKLHGHSAPVPDSLLRLAALANIAAHFDRERERLDIELTLLRQSFPAGSEELFDQFFTLAEASSKLSAVCNSHWQQTAFAKGLKPLR